MAAVLTASALVLAACADDGEGSASVAERRDSWDLVALGDSTVAGAGVRSNEVYTRQYAGLLSDELDVVVEVHDYGSGALPGRIADWTEMVASDEALRADLADAEIVTMFLGFHDIGLITFLDPGGCSGAWPDPLETCLREGTASIPADYDQLLAEIRALVPEATTVLVGWDGGLPMAVPQFEQWSREPYWTEIRRILVDDWRPDLYEAAEAHGAIVVPFYEATHGPDGESLHPEFLQSDGAHFNAEGHRFLAELHLANDGLGTD